MATPTAAAGGGAQGGGRGLLGRLLWGGPEAIAGDEGGSAFGPLTSVPLMGWGEIVGARCSCSSFVPILTGLLFTADVVLAIFAGLDAVNRGPARPWLQFAFSVSVAALYLALFIASLVMYRWERVLRYRYHWVLTLAVATVLSWSNFGVWASWQTRFQSFANGVSASDGNAFVTWVAVNAIGVAGFFARLVVLCVGQGLRYTYSRAIEMQTLVTARTTGGRGLAGTLRSTSAMAAGGGASGGPSRRSPYERRFAGTQWATQRRREPGV